MSVPVSTVSFAPAGFARSIFLIFGPALSSHKFNSYCCHKFNSYFWVTQSFLLKPFGNRPVYLIVTRLCPEKTGVYVLIRKRYLSPPPFPKMIFFPSLHIVFRILLCPFCLNSSIFCNYYTFLLPIFSFSFLLSSFFFSLSPFSLAFPLFSSLFIIFSPDDIG
jgi:hypothetical protein